MKRPYRVGAGQRAGEEVFRNIRGCHAVFAMTELFSVLNKVPETHKANNAVFVLQALYHVL